MSEHTPGPWSYKHNGHYFDVGVIEEGRDMVYPDVCMGVRSCSEADARLIAAAPDLLESLDNVSAAFETLLAHYGPSMSEADRVQRERLFQDARATIRKARGL